MWKLSRLAVSLCLVALLAGCGGGPSQGSGAQFSFTLGSSSVAAFPGEGDATVAIMIARIGSTAALSASVSGLPQGSAAQVTQPGTGDSGSIAINPGMASPGTYALTVTATDGTNNVTQPLTLVVGVTAKVSNSATGSLQVAMSTNFQLGYEDSLLAYDPTIPALLDQLQPHHLRMQVTANDIPETAENTWNFSPVDLTIQPLLTAVDKSPEFQIAYAPAYLETERSNNNGVVDATYLNGFSDYATDLVGYYNAGGFDVGSTHYQSPGTPIKYWGIFNEPNGDNVSPADYVTIYNTLVPAMQAVDPTLKFVAVELSDYGSSEQQYIPAFVQGVTAQVDVVATHFYSSCDQLDPDQTVMNTIPTFAGGVKYIYSQLQSSARLKTVPVWVTENNVNADYTNANGMSTCNPGQTFVPDARGSSAFFAGWRPYEFSQLGQAGAQALYHWDFAADVQYGEFNASTNKLQLGYWVDYWLGQYYPATVSTQVLGVTNSDPYNVEVLAVKKADGETIVMVTDHAVANASDDNGKGSPRTVLVDLSALGSFTTAKELTLDANTDVVNGPAEQAVTYAPQMQVTLGGYGTTFLVLQ